MDKNDMRLLSNMLVIAAVVFVFGAQFVFLLKTALIVRRHGLLSEKLEGVKSTGKAVTARVARSTMNNSRVEGCIVRQVRRWRFPRPDGGEVSVQYPFIFGVQGG